MKICIARIYGRIKYVEPLNHIMDGFYELVKKFISLHPEHEYSYYNITFDGTNPKRNIEAIRDSEVLIIPSEMGFQFYIPGYFHTNQRAKWEDEMNKIRPFVQGKKVITLRYDRADDENLYRNFVFKDIDFEYDSIDEADFPHGIGGMKYWFIQENEKKNLGSLFSGDKPAWFQPVKKEYDFCYWGCVKNKLPGGQNSGDIRHKILKQIEKAGVNCYWIGRFPNLKTSKRFRPFNTIIDDIRKAKATLCFNWLNPKALTSRYQEAIACGLYPLVWQNFDEDNQLVKIPWQRCNTVDEVVEKIKIISEDYEERFAMVEHNFLTSLPTLDSYYNKFEEFLTNKLERTKCQRIENFQ